MKTAKGLTLLLVLLAFAAVPASAKVCPVTSKPATGDYFADHDGQRLYFSCKLAKQEFLADPDKYLDGIKRSQEKQRAKTKQEFCPVSGAKVDRTLWADYEGKRIYLHCKLAKKRFLKKPEVYFNVLVEENVALENTPHIDARFLGASEGFRFVN